MVISESIELVPLQSIKSVCMYIINRTETISTINSILTTNAINKINKIITNTAISTINTIRSIIARIKINKMNTTMHSVQSI